MSIFSQLATSLKAKADALDTEISSAFAAQAAADDAHVNAKKGEYETARAARIVENDQKIDDKNGALSVEIGEKENELAALIGLPTDAGDKDLTDGATVFGAINQLAIEYAGWQDYQNSQYDAAIAELDLYESEVLGSAADFIAAVGF